MNELNQIAIIKMILQKNERITANEIAESIGVSVRTVKYSIKDIQQKLLAHGIRLHSVRGKGYHISIEDRDAYDAYFESISRQSADMLFSKEYEKRAAAIICRILVDDEYKKMEDLAEEMYLSRNVLKYSRPYIENLLEEFNLSIISRPSYGVMIEGEEMNKRFIMLELFLVHDEESKQYLKQAGYLDYFDEDFSVTSMVRKELLNLIRGSGITIYDKYIYRLSRYIGLMARRYRQGFKAVFSEEEKETLIQLPAYGLADRIMSHMQKLIPDFPDDENEKLGLEYLILIWTDPSEADNDKERYPIIYDMAEDYIEEIFLAINRRWNIDLSQIEGARELLTSSIVPICAKICFGKFRYALIGKDVENNEISCSPISIALSSTISDVIRKKEDVRIDRIDVMDFATRIYALICRIPYTYKKPKVLIESKSGRQAATMTAKLIEERLGDDKFESLQPVGYYECRGLDLKEYDYMIMNHNPFSYHYSLPYVYVDLIPSKQQIDDIRQYIIFESYHLKDKLDSFQFGEPFAVRDFDYSDQEQFLTLISYRHASSLEDAPKLKKELEKLNDNYVWNEILFLIVGEKYTKKDIFEVYDFSVPGVWKRKTIRAAVFLSVEFKQDGELLRLTENFTWAIAADNKNIKSLTNINASRDDLIDLIRNRW